MNFVNYLCRLKRAIVILFLSIYLFTTTDANQLLKLPMIYKHFVEHRQADKTMSFISFLDHHYMHGSPKDKDYSKDMQLPFKSSGLFISVIANEYIPCQEQFSIPVPPAPVVHIGSIVQDHQALPDFLANIWQPPKYC